MSRVNKGKLKFWKKKIKNYKVFKFANLLYEHSESTNYSEAPQTLNFGGGGDIWSLEPSSKYEPASTAVIGVSKGGLRGLRLPRFKH